MAFRTYELHDLLNTYGGKFVRLQLKDGSTVEGVLEALPSGEPPPLAPDQFDRNPSQNPVSNTDGFFMVGPHVVYIDDVSYVQPRSRFHASRWSAWLKLFTTGETQYLLEGMERRRWRSKADEQRATVLPKLKSNISSRQASLNRANTVAGIVTTALGFIVSQSLNEFTAPAILAKTALTVLLWSVSPALRSLWQFLLHPAQWVWETGATPEDEYISLLQKNFHLNRTTDKVKFLVVIGVLITIIALFV